MAKRVSKKAQKEAISSKIDAKFAEFGGFWEGDAVRFPPLVLKKPANSAQNSGFFLPSDIVWQQTVASSKPYREARLVHHNYDLSKRWYVIFWAWDESKQRMTRKRLFEPLNRLKTVQERMYTGTLMVNTVNAQLRAGKVLGKDKAFSVKTQVLKMTLLEALQYVIDEKISANLRHSTIRSLKSLKGNVEAWLEHTNLPDFPIRKLSEDHLLLFFKYLQTVRGIGNRTYNNYRNELITIFNFLMKRSPDLFRANPVIQIIDPLPQEVKKHAAFSDSQVKAIIEEAKHRKKSAQFVLFIHMIYYTLARPKEIQLLRVSDVDLDNNRILFRASVSKNKRDEYVTIPETLRQILIESKVLEYPDDYFIFGRNQQPGKQSPYGNAFWERNKNILQKLGFTDREYSLYSFKHSGAISLYLATKDIKMVQRQCRHTSVSQTDAYLRDLGLMVDNEPLLQWKGAI